ncbi:MAG: prepilin peptidase [Ruminococcaceae bacterium]|nr:prepilin peptidase [Oscillospiraceae bacterium]
MTAQEFTMLCVYILAGILGLCVGSFLNVVIYRLPNGMNLNRPGSHCTKCDYTLKWYDNVPVLSYLLLGGKCRKCKTRISPRYMIVEIVNAVLWLLSTKMFWESSPVYACAVAAACSALICIFFIDLEHMLIYNRFTILVALCGVVGMFTDSGTSWQDRLIGAVAGGVVFLGLYYGAIAALKQEGMGFGDVKYAAAAGLLLGWQKLLFAVLAASVTGAVIIVAANRLTKAEKRKEYPFGPFLVAGTLIALFLGDRVISWYLGLLLR